MIRKPSSEWQTLFPKVVVLDPDGWDRTNFDKSWAEPITIAEYANRVARSTCEFHGNPLDLFRELEDLIAAVKDRPDQST